MRTLNSLATIRKSTIRNSIHGPLKRCLPTRSAGLTACRPLLKPPGVSYPSPASVGRRVAQPGDTGRRLLPHIPRRLVGQCGSAFLHSVRVGHRGVDRQRGFHLFGVGVHLFVFTFGCWADMLI